MELTKLKEIIIYEVKEGKLLNDFALLPFQIYKDNDAWVPPLISDFKKYVLGEGNYLNQSGPNIRLIAYKEGKPAGRILVGVNKILNEAKGLKDGYLSLFECIEDEEVANLLLEYAEEWLKDKGVTLIKGPLPIPGGDDNRGFLIDNFTDPTLVMNTYNKPYYNDYLINYGFEKYFDCYAYRSEISNSNIERYEKLVPYAMNKYKFRIDKINLKNIEKDMKDIQSIINEAMPEEWDDFLPPNDEEIKLIADQLVPLADPDLIYIARNLEGRPIGFNITIPDYNQVLKKLNGRLLPFGIIKFLYYKRKIDKLRFFVLFVVPEYRKKGVPSAIYLQSYRASINKGYTFVEGSTIWEYNTDMMRDIENFGGVIYKTYRIYKKSI